MVTGGLVYVPTVTLVPALTTPRGRVATSHLTTDAVVSRSAVPCSLPPRELVPGAVLAPPFGFLAARVEMNEDFVLALAAASVVALVRPSNQPLHKENRNEQINSQMDRSNHPMSPVLPTSQPSRSRKRLPLLTLP